MNLKIVILLSLILVFSSSIYSTSQQVHVDTERQLRDDILTFDHELTSDALTLTIKALDELNASIDSIRSSLHGVDYGLITPLDFSYNSASGSWEAQYDLDDTEPRYVYIPQVQFFHYMSSILGLSYLSDPFNLGDFDLGRGVDTRLPNFPVPSIVNTTFGDTVINKTDLTWVTLEVEHPYPDHLNIRAFPTKGSAVVEFSHIADGVYNGTMRMFSNVKAEIRFTHILFTWHFDHKKEEIQYYDGINYTSPMLQVIDGITDYNAPAIDVASLTMEAYDNGYLNVTVPITDESNITSASFIFSTPNNTYFSSYIDLEYNSTLDRYQGYYYLNPKTPEFLYVTYIGADDEYGNGIYYYNSSSFISPIIQRPLNSGDNPDAEGPVVDKVVSNSTELAFNGAITLDLYLSDSSGYYDLDYHNNNQKLYFSDEDGKDIAVLVRDYPTYSGNELLYLSYQLSVSDYLITNGFPTSLHLNRIVTEDEYRNTRTSFSDVDFTFPEITVVYPENWYVEVSTTSQISDMRSTLQTTGADITGEMEKSEDPMNTSLTWSYLPLTGIILLPILRSKKSMGK